MGMTLWLRQTVCLAGAGFLAGGQTVVVVTMYSLTCLAWHGRFKHIILLLNGVLFCFPFCMHCDIVLGVVIIYCLCVFLVKQVGTLVVYYYISMACMVLPNPIITVQLPSVYCIPRHFVFLRGRAVLTFNHVWVVVGGVHQCDPNLIGARVVGSSSPDYSLLLCGWGGRH